MTKSLGPKLLERIKSMPLNVRREARRLVKLKLDEKYPPKQPKGDTSSASEMLTPSEIGQLRQEQSAQLDLLQKEFPKARVT